MLHKILLYFSYNSSVQINLDRRRLFHRICDCQISFSMQFGQFCHQYIVKGVSIIMLFILGMKKQENGYTKTQKHTQGMGMTTKIQRVAINQWKLSSWGHVKPGSPMAFDNSSLIPLPCGMHAANSHGHQTQFGN